MRIIFVSICILFLNINKIASQNKTQADLIVTNGKVYTVNDNFDIAESFVVSKGKIVAVGKSEDILKQYNSNNIVNADGKAIYPGFIDAHAHFYGYGQSLQTVDLVGTKSWEGVLSKTWEFAVKHSVQAGISTPKSLQLLRPNTWIVGRGWDQNDWSDKSFPDKRLLDSLFPHYPVLLTRVDGHAAIANQTALVNAGLVPNQKIDGGEIETKNGKLTGILIDNAIGLVRSKIPSPTPDQIRKELTDAQKNCFKVGLTTVVDCGLDHSILPLIETMHEKGELKMRLYIMLSDKRNNYEYLFKRGMIKTERLNVRSFKLYADGALGSRGACLLHPYNDRAQHFGFLLKNQTYYESVMKRIVENGFQACTHAIGDSANRAILDIYARVLKGKTDHRWRIEHAQVINPSDFDKFGQTQVIPSVQPTHATSDMYWAGDRLGPERVKGAYAFKQLLKQNGWIPLGTDFPVEDINPLLTFYASVFREDNKGYPSGGFQIENALTREETLRGMTIWAAKGNFEEKEKGSIEVGKYADFVLLSQDLMITSKNDILKTTVINTYLNGEKVY